MGVGKKFTLCAKQERHCALCNVSEQALEKYPPQFTELWVLAIFFFFFLQLHYFLCSFSHHVVSNLFLKG